MNQLSRRMFLGGLGAASLAMPFLPSLARSVDLLESNPYERVLFIVWSHGVSPALWKPTFAGQAMQVGAHVRERRMADAQFGLYMGDHFDGLREKMTMISGLTHLGAWGHAPSNALTASERGPNVNYSLVGTYPSSIDNVLADSGKIYASPPPLDVLRLSMGDNRHTHSIRDTRNVSCLDADVAFAKLFPNGVNPPQMAEVGPTPAERATRRQLLVVDQSLERYRQLLASNKLSASDRAVVEQTMEHYFELERGLRARLEDDAGPQIGEACQDFQVSGQEETSRRLDDHMNLFVQGFACDATRIGYWRLKSSHADVDGAHQADSSNNRNGSGVYSRIMGDNCNWIGQLLRKMDGIVEGNGNTMLDNSLVVVTSDMATSIVGSHPGVDIPLIVAGGLGGKFKMGRYLDYHDERAEGDLVPRGRYLKNARDNKRLTMRGGPPSNELMISICKAFGLEPSDWEVDNQPGFGSYRCELDDLCTKEQSVQAAYLRYYDAVYARERDRGVELPYFRVGA